ncbi:MAG: saccharopine dehydrogenase NADP-binding domain-containing protein [Rickettsiales bacterium]|nr:saccharopine dehydrogenase NADP-binding domain-containing protein [Rickettsiales bacterium]
MRVLILGGYGVFGKRIAEALASEGNLTLIIAGRSVGKARRFADTLGVEAVYIDIYQNLKAALEEVNPHIIINCCGPFQGQDFTVFEQCMSQGIHYIDLADGRDYVAQFVQKDKQAKDGNMMAFTGASTVPAISSAIIDSLLETDFSEIHVLDYGVTPGNQTERGVATVAAILSYVGKSFLTLVEGEKNSIWGWQDLKRVTYPFIGKRWMANCDIPDLDFFQARYPTLKTIRFFAGLELSILHLGLWLVSWPVRWRWLSSLTPFASLCRTISLWFYPLGSQNGGMHLHAKGIDRENRAKAVQWYLIAKEGHGPYIPATPAVIITKKIASGELKDRGAYAAVGFMSKDELMAQWQALNIREVKHEAAL